MAERFKFNDEEEKIDVNDNQQDDLEKEYYDNTDYSYTKSKNKKSNMTKRKTSFCFIFFFIGDKYTNKSFFSYHLISFFLEKIIFHTSTAQYV